MDFNNIILEDEQKELFIRMVEIIKSVPRENRSRMIEANSKDGTCLIMPGKKPGQNNIEGFANGDPEALAHTGLLTMDYGSKGSKRYVISPLGFQYYDWLMKEQGKPVERIETHTFRYLEFEDFKKQYGDAYRKLKQAEEMLWSADKDEQFTTIGHLCREAMQEFADQLYLQVMGKPSSDDKQKTVNRIREVIKSKQFDAGDTVKAFLDALLPYWGAVSDLVQRQEHGAQKEGEPINWEDSRRVVFQSVNVMVELHRAFMK